MNYDKAFFEMIKLRGEELFPLEPPFEWYSHSFVAGVVTGTKEKTAYPWYLSWIREEAGKLIVAVHPYREPMDETVATHRQLEKMSGDDIVHLLATHFLFTDLQHDK